MSCCQEGQLWTGAWTEVAPEEWVGVSGPGRRGTFFSAKQACRIERGKPGERAGEGEGKALQYLQGPGAWGRSTAASSVTYTSIPRRISSPPPVAKTTCRLSHGGSREGGGGGCGSHCLFSDGGRRSEVCLGAGVGVGSCRGQGSH